MTEDDVLELLRAGVKQCGSQIAYARQLDISEQYLGDILARRRKPGPRVLKAIGVERIVCYQEKRP